MSEREAFKEWLPGKAIPCDEYQHVRADGFYVVWQAACAWQRQRDAEICRGELVDAHDTQAPTDYAYNTACGHCESAILNQGSKDETKP